MKPNTVRLAEQVQRLNGRAGPETPGVVVAPKQATPSEPSKARCKSGQVSAAGVYPTAGGLRKGVAGGSPARGWRPSPSYLAGVGGRLGGETEGGWFVFEAETMKAENTLMRSTNQSERLSADPRFAAWTAGSAA